MTVAKPKYDPDTVYHVQVEPGHVVVWQELSFGDRATLQLSGDDVQAALDQGAYVVDPAQVPDAATIK